jgi:hypothetical protein
MPVLIIDVVGEDPVCDLVQTRVVHGYCSRDLVAAACAYANILSAHVGFSSERRNSPRALDSCPADAYLY